MRHGVTKLRGNKKQDCKQRHEPTGRQAQDRMVPGCPPLKPISYFARNMFTFVQMTQEI